MNNCLVLDTNILIDILTNTLQFETIESLFPEYLPYASFMTRVELLSYPKTSVSR
jgi:predicted nucleic acid-binding protein